MPRHFLSLNDLARDELEALIQRAIELKSMLKRDEIYQPFKNKTLGMIFNKSSTRTRVSFEVGMSHFGGSSIFLSPRDTQLGRGEPIEDTARVLSSMVDLIMIRTYSQQDLVTFAKYSKVPVINALTDFNHPCQLLADIQTFFEHKGDITGKTVAWIGDGNNMCHSWMNASRLLGFALNVAVPAGYEPDSSLNHPNVHFFKTPQDAATNAELVVTDVWASMGQERESKDREQAFAGFQVDSALLQYAAKDAIFMHCLPAHRGEEVSAEVIDGSQSVVWDEAENRLHAQKALMEFLLDSVNPIRMLREIDLQGDG